ncbi:unnamed protein product [Cyprideis torosa]|uniref:(3R)-3-hydroxyacyl-CoA dehydrogenase n=1 Tax=Cyprideis torosa TaxID=163714 RepID=A0A7R8ZNE8_9CRUS|nr:unnamed protein product [Cyprideis torosa]CAG0886176.1 unnamed protein product [Cyprideis torosa]
MLAGRVALITGAGGGIGRAICQVFAREGATVVATDVQANAAKESIASLPQASLSHLSFPVDVTSSESISALMDSIGKELDGHFPPTILVNSAGITRDDFLLRMDPAAFDQVIDVNLKGTFLMTQAFGLALTQAKVTPASVVNISSVVGQMGNMGQCNYSASKAAVEAMTKTAAKEFAQFGIRVNCVAPGFIATPMTDKVPEKVKAKINDMIPMKRMGKAEEVAELIAFLASDRASYVTGSTYNVNGGFYM